MVYGFRVNPNNVTDQYKNIDNLGHAWAEFYIEGYGWLIADPTTYDSRDKDREVCWDGFVNDKYGDHVVISYDEMEYIGIGLSGNAIFKGVETDYYIKLAE